LAAQVDVVKIMEYPNIKTFAEFLGGLEKAKNESLSVEDRAALRRMNARRKQ
jgi:hypothetical protein